MKGKDLSFRVFELTILINFTMGNLLSLQWGAYFPSSVVQLDDAFLEAGRVLVVLVKI